jgi:hypothetical protein
MLRIFTLIVALVCFQQTTQALESINDFKWDHRIILIRTSSDAEQILNALKQQVHEIKDRDIYWFVFSNESIESNYQCVLEENFYSNIFETYFVNDEIKTILIGKDGGIKNTSDTLDLQNLFDLIDTMPMRQLEMSE